MASTEPDPAQLWRRAASFAARAHQGQFRKDGLTPYAAHPARVAATVGVLFGCDDAEALAIAWLHDTIEDSTTDYEDLAEAFGVAVADGVASLSKNPALPEPERERMYDEGLERAGWRPKLVKLADVLDNMADLATDAPAPLRARLLSRAERAVVIARRDGSGRAELARGIALVEQLIASVRGSIPGSG
jgi:guanosine-3',5'-bis(diphosphate) 3'-pyrophosphohydrolase